MRPDIVPGAIFPDYELSDHTAKHRSSPNCKVQHPMVLVLSRGDTARRTAGRPRGSCNSIGSSRSAIAGSSPSARTISLRPMSIAPESARTGRFSPIAGRKVQKDLDIAEYTDPTHNPMIPHVIVLEPGLVIYKIYNGYWFFGRPTVGGSPPGPARRHQEVPAGLGHHNAGAQSGVASKAARNCFIRTAKRTSRRSVSRIRSSFTARAGFCHCWEHRGAEGIGPAGDISHTIPRSELSAPASELVLLLETILRQGLSRARRFIGNRQLHSSSVKSYRAGN